MIILIFVLRDAASGLAHASSHCVLGITLPPSNATTFSLQILACQGCEEEFELYLIVLPGSFPAWTDDTLAPLDVPLDVDVFMD